MFKHLTRRSAAVCMSIGRRILPKLQADPRLAEAAAALQAGQEAFEEKMTAYGNAVEGVRSAGAARDQAYRGMEDRLREFALNLLSVVRNNHGADIYLRYFPVGYGTAIRENPEQIQEVTRVVLGKLGEETDPWLVSLRDRISSAQETFLAAQSHCVAAITARNDAFAYLAAGKRAWVQSLVVARLKARQACIGDDAYVRAIFSPADPPQRGAAPAPDSDEAPSVTPAKPEAPANPATSIMRPSPILPEGESAARLQAVGAS
jgi:hypothetical protein